MGESLGERLRIGKSRLEMLCDSKRLGERLVGRGWVRYWVKYSATSSERLVGLLDDTFDDRFGIRLCDNHLQL